jgi:hypothetical protein
MEDKDKDKCLVFLVGTNLLIVLIYRKIHHLKFLKNILKNLQHFSFLIRYLTESVKITQIIKAVLIENNNEKRE